jgi:hypothetical protein
VPLSVVGGIRDAIDTSGLDHWEFWAFIIPATILWLVLRWHRHRKYGEQSDDWE